MSGTTAQDLLRATLATLLRAGNDNAAGDARALVAAAMGIARDRLTLHLRDPVDDATTRVLNDLVSRRASGMPVSRILGERLFFGRSFAVTPDVLDPRPETEILVIQSLAGPFERVLDLGTGSGCILATLLAERPAAQGLGTDISEAALRCARKNAARLGVEGRAAFAVSDWFGQVPGRFDLIVSNPPYIAQGELPGLAREVREHDPELALSDGGDGLGAYRAIADRAGAHLRPRGRLLVEIGPTQGAAVRALFAVAGLETVACHPDLDGRDRVVSARMPAV